MNANTIKYIGWALILLIGSVIGWQLTKAFTPGCPEIKRDTVRIPFDTTAFIAKLNIKPKIITIHKDTGSIKWKDNIILIPYYKATKADTIRDYNAYHSTLWKKDTLTNDKNLFYEATSGINQNRLISFEGRYFWKHPSVTTNNNPIQPLTNQLYLGIGGGTDFGNVFKIEGRVTLKTKRDNLWGVKVEKISNIPKLVYSVSHDFKIHL